jgi:hypothetical protein
MRYRSLLRSELEEQLSPASSDYLDALKEYPKQAIYGDADYTVGLAKILSRIEDMPESDAKWLLPICNNVADRYGIEAESASFLYFVPEKFSQKKMAGAVLYTTSNPSIPLEYCLDSLIFAVPQLDEHISDDYHEWLMKGYFAGMIGTLWKGIDCDRRRREFQAAQESMYLMPNADWYREAMKAGKRADITEITDRHGFGAQFFDFVSFYKHFRTR